MWTLPIGSVLTIILLVSAEVHVIVDDKLGQEIAFGIGDHWGCEITAFHLCYMTLLFDVLKVLALDAKLEICQG